jgi:glycine/D-amino acid oxidase-like deaminating enzyme
MKASEAAHHLVVVGHGAAGLSAAVAAAEMARASGLDVEITLLEKADAGEAGGNTLWSPSYMRLDAPDRMPPDFETAAAMRGISTRLRAMPRRQSPGSRTMASPSLRHSITSARALCGSSRSAVDAP